MDQAVLSTRGGVDDDQPTFNKPGDILPSKVEGPRSTCSIFEDPLAASASTSFADPADDLMKAYVEQRETSPHLDEIVQKDGHRPGLGGDVSECSESKMTSSLEPIDAVMTGTQYKDFILLSEYPVYLFPTLFRFLQNKFGQPYIDSY